MLQKFFCLLALLTASFLSAQTIPKTDNICFFQDAKTGKPITIVNDSLVYKGELKTPTKLKHTDYPESLKKYNYHFTIKNHTYLVHEGCGAVLEYRNDSIIRIDDSFLHKNQFGALPFVYNNQICLFGGYGLFTNKNIITHFSFKSKEWFEFITKENNIPSPRNNSNGFKIGNNLYVFGGYENAISPTYEKEKIVYQLNLKTGNWNSLGKYSESLYTLISRLGEYYSFSSKKRLYFINNENIIEIDIIHNKINYYKNNEVICLEKMYYDDNLKCIVSINNISAQNILVLKIQYLKTLLKQPYKTEPFYIKSYFTFIFHSVIILFTILLLFIIVKLTRRFLSKKITYTKNKFYYKSKAISNLDSLEEKILVYLFENRNQFIQLNQLNTFFESEKQDNFNAIVKKRDLVFVNLLFKLNSTLQIEEQNIIITQKNETDKRIKEIKLNPLYFSLKNN
jgi:hypothetical protein